MSTASDLRKQIERMQGQKEQKLADIQTAQGKLRESKKTLKLNQHALDIVNFTAQKTQEQISFHIGNLTSMALDSVFPDPYTLLMEFEIKREKTECNLSFVKNDEKTDPISAAGGGAVDVASFALRVAAWSMQNPRTRNTIILDEPFKHLSSELLPAASEMLAKLSEKLQLQIIMITHSEELIPENAIIFKVKNKNEKSIIE